MKTFQDVLRGWVGREMIDLATCPRHTQVDYAKRNANVAAGIVLCPRCDGTGNELVLRHRFCTTCGGTGVWPHDLPDSWRRH